jgi:ubiquinone/menaquinone biosynthesis C-methylase UbiE
MSILERWVWAPLLDWVMRQEPIMRQRAKVVPQAAGRVLEIGMGSGLNLAYYDASQVERVWGLDPSAELQERSRARAGATRVPVELLTGSAEDIPFDDASFDTVLTTFTLCSIPDVGRALREMRRVLRPAGRLVFAEHGLAPDAGVARWQQRLNPAWLFLSGGCNMNRPIAALLGEAGFVVAGLETLYLPGPRVLTYNYWGAAVPA